MGETRTASITLLDPEARASREGSPDPATPDSTPSAPELSRLWVTVLRRKISSLAVVPAEPGTSGRAFAQELALIGRHRGGRIALISAEGVSGPAGLQLADEMDGQVERGLMVIVSVDPILQSEGGLSLVLRADAAIIVVRLGVAAMASVRATVESIGREHVLGCVTLKGG